MGTLENAATIVNLLKNLSDIARKLDNAELTGEIAKFQGLVLKLHAEGIAWQSQKAVLLAENARLRKLLNPKGELVLDGGCYWLKRDGQRDGPYCLTCREKDKETVHLIPTQIKGEYVCNFHPAAKFYTAEYQRPSMDVLSGSGVFSRRNLAGF